MFFSDFQTIFQWWFLFFIIGVIFLPLTSLIFSNFFDKGYIFSKILGIIFISYVIFLLGILKILLFSKISALLVLFIFLLINMVILVRYPLILKTLKKTWKIFLLQELIFLLTLTFWSYIRGFQPDIQGLEKYMDFGFVNSILRADYFPPKDMWFTPFPINYYYFGHLLTAVLIKLSEIPSNIAYNLMLSTIFAFTYTCAFSIGTNLVKLLAKNEKKLLNFSPRVLFGGMLTAALVTFSGNLHTIYAFFKPYVNENPLPLWQLAFSPTTFPNSYWYPNATRFIYNTIHEFPIYSFVVSDLHGHVLDIPIVLLTIAILLSLISKSQTLNHNSKKSHFNVQFLISNFSPQVLFIGFLLAVMYMTNAWDGLIYAGLTALVFFYLASRSKNYMLYAIHYALIIFGFFLFALPFSLNFKPFVSGIGILCAPSFLTKIGKFGPLLFEADHCQKSPWWQLLTLYGFFYFWVISFLLFLRKTMKQLNNLTIPDIFITILIILSTLLIILPEFVYVKDIYPAHYRANTMFKLVYQSFMMLSISSAYIIIRIISQIRRQIFKIFNFYFVFFIFSILLLILVMIYPQFAISSYYDLKTYRGLDGTSYLKTFYSTDYEAIVWLNKNIKGQTIILEAQGDSYTDFARVSSNTGLPTVLGWTVHEWLWRGTYDIPAPRINDVQILYETEDINLAKNYIKKYNISLVFIGDLERQKYPSLNENKFEKLGRLIYQNGKTKIYKIKG